MNPLSNLHVCVGKLDATQVIKIEPNALSFFLSPFPLQETPIALTSTPLFPSPKGPKRVEIKFGISCFFWEKQATL